MIRIIADPINIRALDSISKITPQTKRGMRRGLYQLGKKLVEDTKEDILRKPRNGRKYKIRRGLRLIVHRASVGGEAPASISGDLWRSLTFKVSGPDELEFGYNTSAPYGRYLEQGTSKIKPRPGLKINIKKNNKDGRNYLEREIRSALK